MMYTHPCFQGLVVLWVDMVHPVPQVVHRVRVVVLRVRLDHQIHVAYLLGQEDL